MTRQLFIALAFVFVGFGFPAGAEPTVAKLDGAGGKSAAVPAIDRLWSGVVIATNPKKPAAPPAELREYAPRLERVFGYSQYALIGSASTPITGQGESWLVPSQTFWLGVKARRTMSKETRGGYLLNIQLFHDKRPLVDTEARLAPGCPLFIRGPEYGAGQLIIVLQVKGAAN